MVQLSVALNCIAPIKQICESATDNSYLRLLGEQLSLCSEMCERIQREITPDPPAVQGRPNTIARGVNAELDELRDIQAHGKERLLQIQQREIDATGIQSLKIGYNNVFGYYLEVRNTYKDQVPETWIRKQTLVNAERYITQELKEYEDKILNAEGQIQIIETRLYRWRWQRGKRRNPVCLHQGPQGSPKPPLSGASKGATVIPSCHEPPGGY